MSDREAGRDERLGAAVRDLPVAPPGPGFEERVLRALQDEAAAMRDRRPGAERRARHRPRAWTGAAAAALLAVLAVVVGLPGGRPAAALTLAELQERVHGAVAGLRTLQGEISVSGELLPGAPPDEVGRFTFAMTADGDFRVTALDGSDDLSYDARSGLQRHVVAGAGGGPPTVTEARGLAPGRPDPAPLPSLLDRSLGSFVRTFLAVEGGPPVGTTTVEGRPAWRVVVPGVASGPSGTTTLDVTVDQGTGLPVRIVRTSAGRQSGELVLRRLVVDAPLDRALFRLEPPEQGARSSVDVGFVPVDEAGARAIVGYAPLLPAAVPDGFVRTHLTVARVASGTGLANPLSRNVVSAAYQRGFDRIVVTTRDTGGDPARWRDPLAETPFPEWEGTRRLGAGTLAGVDATVVVDRTGAHLWAVAGGLVVTVAGDLGVDQLVAVAESLEAR